MVSLEAQIEKICHFIQYYGENMEQLAQGIFRHKTIISVTKVIKIYFVIM